MTDAADAVHDAASGDAPDAGALANPFESLASDFGWKPKSDDFRGEWLDAEAFLKNQPARLKEAKEKASRATLEAQGATKAATLALTKAKAQMRRELKDKIKTAAEAGDTDTVMEATDRLVEVESAPSGEVEAFKVRNAWLDTDPDAASLAASVTNRLAAQGSSVKDQLEAAEKAVRKRFPELFEEDDGDDEPQPRVKTAKTPPHVETGRSNAPGAPRKRGLADVPTHIRSAWTPKVLRMFDTTAEAMAATYWKEQPNG